MKTSALVLTALLLVCGAMFAHASSSNSGSQSALALAPASTGYLNAAPGSSSHFAQIETAKTLPVSPTMIVTLVALFVLGMRLMGVRHAHALAEHERHSHHGRAQMFRSLHEERSSRR